MVNRTLVELGVTGDYRARSSPTMWRLLLGFAAAVMAVLFIAAAAGTVLWFSRPELVVNAVLDALEVMATPSDRREVLGAQSIVVLGGRPSRAVKAAELHKQSGLPIYVAGSEDLLELTRRNILPRWIDGFSLDTETSAAVAQCTLRLSSIKRVVLVTDVWHMPRAARWFRWYGFDVVAVASRIESAAEQNPGERRFHALHELGGLLEFEIRRLTASRLACYPQQPRH